MPRAKALSIAEPNGNRRADVPVRRARNSDEERSRDRRAQRGDSAHETHLVGLGNGTSTEFEFDGDIVPRLGVCQANETLPFVWLRTHGGGLAGQFVDPINHLASLAGKYHLVVVANPSCAWAAGITPE